MKKTSLPGVLFILIALFSTACERSEIEQNTVPGTKFSVHAEGISVGNIQGIAAGLLNGGTLKITNPALKINLTSPVIDGKVKIEKINAGDGRGFCFELSAGDDYQIKKQDNVTIGSSDIDLKNIFNSTSIIMLPKTGPDGARGTIRVTVTDSAPTPAGLFAIEIQAGTTVFKTGPDGTAEAELPLGDYTLSINPESRSDCRFEPDSVPVSLTMPGELSGVISRALVQKTRSLTIPVKKVESGGNISDAGPGLSITLDGNAQTTTGSSEVIFADVKYGDNSLLEANIPTFHAYSHTVTVDENTPKTIYLLLDTCVRSVSGKISGGALQPTRIEISLPDNSILTTHIEPSSGPDDYTVGNIPALNGMKISAFKNCFNPTDPTTLENIAAENAADVNFSFDDAGDGSSAGSRKKTAFSGRVCLTGYEGETGEISVTLNPLWPGTPPVSKQEPAPSADFSFDDLYQGKYSFEVSFPGYQTIKADELIIDTDIFSCGTIFLKPDYASVNFDIDPNPADGDISDALIYINEKYYITDSNGIIEIKDIKAGEYSYLISKDGFEYECGTVTLTEGTNTVIPPVELDKLAQISGFIKDNDDRIYPDADIYITGAGCIQPDATGFFSAKVPQGYYTVTVSGLPDGLPDVSSEPFILAPGDEYNVQTSWNGSGSIGDEL